jgi:uncharacterized damage-inducible protein DinB
MTGNHQASSHVRISGPLVDELKVEASTTERVLARVPEAHLAWKPHVKSMSLGQLALHVATLPSLVAQFLSGDALDFDAVPKTPPTVGSHAELLEAFAASTGQAQAFLTDLTDERALATWRAAMLRSLLFNHWYHHRGQLVVYLRLLDVPVPSVYGPTADENPFMTA